MLQDQKRVRRYWKPVTIVTSSSEESSDYDDSLSGEESDRYKGSSLRCAKCDARFTGLAKKMAIGCDTEYC